MGSHAGSSSAASGAYADDHDKKFQARRAAHRAAQVTHRAPDRALAVRARQQIFGFALLGVLCCAAAVVLSRWSPHDDPGRWFWVVAGSLIGVVCLVNSHRVHGGRGADRDASPYYGIFAGVTSGALLLLLLAVDSWVLPGVFVVMATVLGFMAWVEQSAIGMTAAVSVAVLGAGSGIAVLGEPLAVGLGSLGLGLMLLAAAASLRIISRPAAG